MNRIDAKFEKVSYEQFEKDVIENMIDIMGHDIINKDCIQDFYDNIHLPKRATRDSAGYDFFFPFPQRALQSESVMHIPTGVKCKIPEGWWLGIFPKSSLGINYRVQMDDTIAVIDGDYYNCAKNEGHICVKLANNDRYNRILRIDSGESYCQGIFLPYGIILEDNETAVRTGGLGSTQAKATTKEI